MLFCQVLCCQLLAACFSGTLFEAIHNTICASASWVIVGQATVQTRLLFTSGLKCTAVSTSARRSRVAVPSHHTLNVDLLSLC